MIRVSVREQDGDRQDAESCASGGDDLGGYTGIDDKRPALFRNDIRALAERLRADQRIDLHSRFFSANVRR